MVTSPTIAEVFLYMLGYLVYDSDYRLFYVFEERPTYSYEFGWNADGWYDTISEKDIPESTKLVLAEKGMLEVCVSHQVLFHTNKPVHKSKEDE